MVVLKLTKLQEVLLKKLYYMKEEVMLVILIKVIKFKIKMIKHVLLLNKQH